MKKSLYVLYLLKLIETFNERDIQKSTKTKKIDKIQSDKSVEEFSITLTKIYSSEIIDIYRNKNDRFNIFRTIKKNEAFFLKHEKLLFQRINKCSNILLTENLIRENKDRINISAQLSTVMTRVRAFPLRMKAESYSKIILNLVHFCRNFFCAKKVMPENIAVSFLPQLKLVFLETRQIISKESRAKIEKDIFLHPSYINKSIQKGGSIGTIIWSFLIIMVGIELNYSAEKLKLILPSKCFQQNFTEKCFQLLKNFLESNLENLKLKNFILHHLTLHFSDIRNNNFVEKFIRDLLLVSQTEALYD